MRVKVLFEAPTTYEVVFNTNDFDYEIGNAGYDHQDPESVGEWFETHAPYWLIEDGEVVDMDCEEVGTLEVVAE